MFKTVNILVIVGSATAAPPGVRRVELAHHGSFAEVSAAGATFDSVGEETEKFTGVRRMVQKVRTNSDSANADQGGVAKEIHQAASTKVGVMYGIVTNQLPRYRKQLEAVMDTWASRTRAEGRFFAIAGRTYPSQWREDGAVIAADCDDSGIGNACKEANLILEAKRRGASWLFIAGEDNYVDTVLVDSVLQAENASVPQGFGCVGCGKGLKQYGEMVATHGGFCGGCGEALSGAALERLGSGGAALVQEYGREKQCDMSTSAALLDRGIPLLKFPGDSMKHIHGMRYDSKKGLDERAATGLSFHYVTPAVMRYIYGKKNAASEKEMHLLEDAAFKNGCVRGFECDPNEAGDARMAGARPKQVIGPVLFERLASSLGR